MGEFGWLMYWVVLCIVEVKLLVYWVVWLYMKKMFVCLVVFRILVVYL